MIYEKHTNYSLKNNQKYAKRADRTGFTDAGI